MNIVWASEIFFSAKHNCYNRYFRSYRTIGDLHELQK